MNKNQLHVVQQYLETASANILAAKKMVADLTGDSSEQVATEKSHELMAPVNEPAITPQGKVIEGVFDGQNMIGPDGKQYSVPANYASKSKLVEGDVMKLTIAPDGSFIYKQIGPIERERLIGILSQDQETDRYYVTANNHNYKVLLASVTYFKGEVSDEAIILKPKGSESEWAAVENIIKPLPGEERNKPVAAEKPDQTSTKTKENTELEKNETTAGTPETTVQPSEITPSETESEKTEETSQQHQEEEQDKLEDI